MEMGLLDKDILELIHGNNLSKKGDKRLSYEDLLDKIYAKQDVRKKEKVENLYKRIKNHWVAYRINAEE